MWLYVKKLWGEIVSDLIVGMLLSLNIDLHANDLDTRVLTTYSEDYELSLPERVFCVCLEQILEVVYYGFS